MALSHAFRIKTSHSDPFQAEAHIRQASSKSFTFCLLHVAAASSANLSHDEKSHKTVGLFFFSHPSSTSLLNLQKLLVSSELRISLDDKFHSVLTVGNSHIPTPLLSSQTFGQLGGTNLRRLVDRQVNFPQGCAFSVLDLEEISAPKLIYFYLISMFLSVCYIYKGVLIHSCRILFICIYIYIKYLVPIAHEYSGIPPRQPQVWQTTQ